MYIHERENWTEFRWDHQVLEPLLEAVNRKQGLLYGRLANLGMDDRLKSMAANLVEDVYASSEIEGISLNMDQVRSSIARKLGIETVRFTAPSHYVDSVVTVMLEAMKNFDKPVSKVTLCAWQSAFFPSGRSAGYDIETGAYRTHEEHIVSGNFGRERVHYIAPGPERIEEEMTKFIDWFNAPSDSSSVIRSAIAHLWFLSIHPFEDGNGRLARILSDIALAKGDGSSLRFYNISSQINKDKKHYYDILEATQRADGDITPWLLWYVRRLSDALDDSLSALTAVLNKTLFWQRNAQQTLSERQIAILNLFLDGYEAKITSKTWASLAKCSKDTAIRDIQDLVAKNILVEDIPGAKRPSYSIVYDPEDLSQWFSQISIETVDDRPYLTALYRGTTPVRERISQLDADRFAAGDLLAPSLLAKYCAHLRL